MNRAAISLTNGLEDAETAEAASVALIGERFVEALARQDAAALRALLRPDIDFRAMTPGRFRESNDAAVIVDEMMLGTWFAAGRRITSIISIESEGSRASTGSGIGSP